MIRELVVAGLVLAGIGSSHAQGQALCPTATTLDVLSQSLPCITGFAGSGNVFTITAIYDWKSKGSPLIGSSMPIQMSDITVQIGASSGTAVYFDLTSPKFAVDAAHAAAFGFVMTASGQYINSELQTFNTSACSDLGLIASSVTFGAGAGALYAVNLLNGLTYQRAQAVVGNVTGSQATTFHAAMVGFGCKLFAPTFRVNLSQ